MKPGLYPSLDEARGSRHDARERYRRFRNAATREALSIKNEFCRGLAIDALVSLCTRAGEVEPARALLKLLDDNDIRERILEDFPELRT